MSGLGGFQLPMSDAPVALQVVGSPVPIRTINRQDITGIRLTALGLACQLGPQDPHDAFSAAEQIVLWALRPATPEEEAATKA
jgi:hypothetical protein